MESSHINLQGRQMKLKVLLLLMLYSLSWTTSAWSEEVIWRNEPIPGSAAIVPDITIGSLGPGLPAFSDYALAQVFVQCQPGQPRIGQAGTINRVTTFFQDDSQIQFDTLPDAVFNPENGQFEIPGLARLNFFEVPSTSSLPMQNDNPDNGIIIDVMLSQNLMEERIEVRAEDLINKLPAPLPIQENTVYYVGLTPFFFSTSDALFVGLHLTNPFGRGNEFQSAVRQTAPDPGDWMFAGDVYSQGKPQYATIKINGPPDTIVGDTNGDGVVNLLDVSGFVDAISSGKFLKAADINGDGFVSLLDVSPFVAILSGN